jgi:ParB/RepB/Spo0J family partition protein
MNHFKQEKEKAMKKETLVEHLKLGKVIPSERNYRRKVDKQALEELTDSVRQKGIIQPIIVRPVKDNGHYEIVAGYRRYLAATAAELATIPAIIEKLDDESALEVAMIENSQREDVNPIDEALGFKRMLDIGTDIETVAARIGHPVAYVLGRIKLLDLCMEARKAVAEGRISLGHAQVFLRLRSKNEQKGLLAAILQGDGITVSGAKTIVRRHSLALKEAPFDTEKCAACQYRSGNQAALFPELTDTDECSDPACFQKKETAYYEGWARQKEEAGFRVIRGYDEIRELGGLHDNKLKRIVPRKADADYHSVCPPRYKTDCAKCTDHHAYYFYEEAAYNGRRVEHGELCLNPKCLARMFKEIEDAKEKETIPAGRPERTEAAKVSPVTLLLHANACRDRFLVKHIPERVDKSTALTKRFIIYHLLERFGQFSGDAKTTRDVILKAVCPAEQFKPGKFSGWELYLVVMGVPEKKLDRLMKTVVEAAIPYTDPKALLHMTPEAGIDMEKDFQMDKEFLNTKKKAELIEMAKALGLPVEFTGKEKKSEMLDAILALELTGKRTQEIAESCALKELKDVGDTIIWGREDEAEVEEDAEAA